MAALSLPVTTPNNGSVHARFSCLSVNDFVGFTALVFTMWIRAFLALSIFGGTLLTDGNAFAQKWAKSPTQFKLQALRAGPDVLGVPRRAPRFRRPAARPGSIVVGNITKSQAVRAAIRCNRGGEALKPPVRRGDGFVVKILKGSYVRFIRVDKNGQCG